MVFAHAGGWDELLLVLGPVGIFAGLLALANRRAARLEGGRDLDTVREEGQLDEP